MTEADIVDDGGQAGGAPLHARGHLADDRLHAAHSLTLISVQLHPQLALFSVHTVGVKDVAHSVLHRSVCCDQLRSSSSWASLLTRRTRHNTTWTERGADM